MTGWIQLPLAALASALLATEMPFLDDLTKLGVAGAAVGLAWYMAAYTIPGMQKGYNESLKQMLDSMKEVVTLLRDEKR